MSNHTHTETAFELSRAQLETTTGGWGPWEKGEGPQLKKPWEIASLASPPLAVYQSLKWTYQAGYHQGRSPTKADRDRYHIK